ncbi:MAG: cupin domain-containing protein [Negativicutes bacterium]|nr:cupin domain-containing protein [Negativicutes bacterium]
MIIRAEDLPVETRPAPKIGTATTLLTPAQMHNKNRLFSRVCLKPGGINATHTHAGDFEVFYILSGRARVSDNGSMQELKPGDVLFTDAGESHSIENASDTDLEYIALITYV